ncbi:MAG: tryptophan--tRNA ligase [Clostridia bacterium]
MKRLLTGLQPTGVITLGNYIGAVKQMVDNQDLFDSFLFVADLHSITMKQDPKTLHENIRSLLALYFACGIDPKKNTIYLQSEIEFIPCISWLLECNASFGELSRMTQFKDKSSKNINFSAGLFTYPVLMAADILGVDTDIVPVGIDQKQHVELARNLAVKFNNAFGSTFVLPEPKISKSGTKIVDLLDPSKKMSKSNENQKGVIRLLDEPEVIRKKIMSATTDSEMRIVFDEKNKPGISNLLNIFNALSGIEISDIEKKYANQNYGTFKKDVADLVVEKLSAIQENYYSVINSNEIDEALSSGRDVAQKLTKEKYEKMKELMGLKR